MEPSVKAALFEAEIEQLADRLEVSRLTPYHCTNRRVVSDIRTKRPLLALSNGIGEFRLENLCAERPKR
jgi:hypothetical protein